MIFDTDDLYDGHDRLDLLERLRDANPALRVTAFAIPARCPGSYLDTLPDWIEVVPHGRQHGDPPADGGECRDWSYGQMAELIAEIEDGHPRWQRGFKAPGWQLSTEAMNALNDAQWFLADQRYNDARRPVGLWVHCEGEGDHVHTHVQNVCGNGLEETFPTLLARVAAAEHFDLVSEAAMPWHPIR